MEGWIKIYRDIRMNILWNEKPFDKKSAWIDILLMANHKDNEFLLGLEKAKVKRGEFITSESKLMLQWKWSKTRVRNFLKFLEDENMIIKKSDKKKTTISVVNYSKYQDAETSARPQEDHKKPTTEPRKDTNNNDKNEKKNTYTESFEKFYSNYPRPEHKHQTFKNWQKRLREYSVDQLMEAASNYKDEMTKIKRDKEFMTNSSNFLGNKCVFMDYLSAPDETASDTSTPIKRTIIFEERRIKV